jgi:hypothetical protein
MRQPRGPSPPCGDAFTPRLFAADSLPLEQSVLAAPRLFAGELSPPK